MSHDIIYLSFGAGVQSTALLGMSQLGVAGVPRADIAVFADTGDEMGYTYKYIEHVARWLESQENPIELHVIHRDDEEGFVPLSRQVVDANNGARRRCAAIPAFTECATHLVREHLWDKEDEGDERAPVVARFAGEHAHEDARSFMESHPARKLSLDVVAAETTRLQRQCTAEYKIRPIESFVRRYLGVDKGERIGKRRALCMMGISIDEVHRMRESRTAWVDNSYPLCDLRISRAACADFVEKDMGLPRPKSSSCLFCPYHTGNHWKRLRDQYPDEFEKACQIDEGIRDMTATGITNPVFLHRSLRPLRDEPFDDGQLDLFAWGEECGGHCGV